IRGAPHNGLSRLIVRIKSRMSAGTAGLPTPRGDFQRQYRPNPLRCQRTSVSGLKTTAASAPAQEASPAPSPSVPAQPANPAPTNAPPQPSGGTSSPTASLAPGVTSNCSKYYTVQSGDTCNSVAQMFGTSFTELQALNTGLDSGCSNLWLGYAYCVAA